MRNFEERKAEVFRRSEKRIKERKRNRNRILAMCIPLCLVLTIFSVMMIPGMLPVGTDNAENETMGHISDGTGDADGAVSIPGSVNESKTHNFVSVTVKDGDYSNKFTEMSSVNKVFHQVYDILEANGGYRDVTDMPGTGNGDVQEEDASDANAKVECIIITMVTDDGSERVFLLDDLTLYDQAFNKEIELTTAQRNDLLVALELADY